jgi:hypothetical protein
MNALKRFILWDYPRAGWQYDIIVAVILAFIFLTPRELFHDQPKASSIVMLPSEHTDSAGVFWLEPELLAGVPEAERTDHAAAMLKAKTGKKQTVSRLEPIFDSEREVRGYMAFTTR